MAYTDTQKAEIIATILNEEMTYPEAAERFGVALGTLHRWMHAGEKSIKVKRKTVKVNVVDKQEAEIMIQGVNNFDTKLKILLSKSLDMLEAWTDICSDPEFIQREPEACRELGELVLDRCDRIVSLVRRPQEDG